MSRVFRGTGHVGAAAFVGLLLVGGDDLLAQREHASTAPPLAQMAVGDRPSERAKHRAAYASGDTATDLAADTDLGSVVRPPPPVLLTPTFLGRAALAAQLAARAPRLSGVGRLVADTMLRASWLGPAFTHVPFDRAPTARRKPAWRYAALGAGIGGLGGGLLGWLAGNGMHGGMNSDATLAWPRDVHTRTAVAVGIASGAAFGTLVALIVYALEAPDTNPP